jgi:hypothetical protein
MEQSQSIQLTQVPKIEHSLIEIGKTVSERIAALNLENQVATEDTLKTLKNIRSELNKEAKEFEDQRKAVKNAILTPYDEFDDVYKSEIIDKYKSADEILRAKINEYEMNLKAQKKESLSLYFKELCEMEQIDWLTFDQLGIEVTLSTSEKKYKEDILSKVQKIVDDINLISTETYAAEMIVEYKKTLNASQAIQQVRLRKQDEKLAQERLIQERASRRATQLRDLSFISHDISRTYNWIRDESIMIPYSDIQDLTDEEWIKAYAELEAIAKQPKAAESAPVLQAPTEVVQSPACKESLQAQKEPIVEAFILVKDTPTRLIALGELLRANNYKYENIKENGK